ncbi:unnamed protein product [Chilo suppressalis]|uniref:Uncharacterized protein n=1 Tax=Chilo suppressalis TaxID=168631 RepID=A0ABN8BBV2_CHISP|nr:unnamed protein product [Chilo suppressalis]
MDSGLGDNHKSPRFKDENKEEIHYREINETFEPPKEEQTECSLNDNLVTPEMIEDNEMKLKERIAQCRNVIESLKLELNKEKSKLEKETKNSQGTPMSQYNATTQQDKINTEFMLSDMFSSNMYSASVDNRLNYDESLVEYEKQLQRYQNTLNMAQMEKKNAIRKQMLAKAFRLKLLEVENQCNIELLRVKQSLQCLEPLQMIANKWKTSTNEATNDENNFELMPRFPELNAISGSDLLDASKDDYDTKASLENLGNCGAEQSFLE